MNRLGVGVSTDLHGSDSWRIGAVAGLAGGAVEIGWIVLYQYLAGHESAPVARGVTRSLIPELVAAPVAVPLGVAIHMALAVLLGIVVAVLVNRLVPRVVGTAMEPVIVIAMLAGVWAVNFFVVLPVINPGFVSLVPYGASLASKVLFGFAAAFVFSRAHQPRLAREQRLQGDIHVQ